MPAATSGIRNDLDNIYAILAKIEVAGATTTANIGSIADELVCIHNHYDVIDVRVRRLEQVLLPFIGSVVGVLVAFIIWFLRTSGG